MSYYGIKRKVFISFHQDDRDEVDDFIDRWSTQGEVFTPKALGISMNDDFVNSTNPEYIMGRIRKEYLGDSTVTIVLIGSCTHSRRYVDWELKASLRQGASLPNGVMGVILPSLGRTANLPPRLQDNWSSGHVNCYARLWVAPSSASELDDWIEDAFDARTSRSHLIENGADMIRYNRQCLVHGVTH